MERQGTSGSLRLHLMLPHITTLGPYVRMGIWTQGCLKRCPGCVTPESQPLTGGRQVSYEEIERLFFRFSAHEGLTVSGGEPFLQARALCGLIDRLRAVKDLGVIVYTGYTLEELMGTGAPEGSLMLLDRTDLLIDGPYRAELDDGGALRGSSNQRVIPLTERYRDRLFLFGPGQPRRIELRYTGEGLGLVGIPKSENKGEGTDHGEQ